MRLLVDLNPAEGVRRPRVVDTQTGRVLLDLWDTWDWDAKVVRNDRASATLALRRGGAHVTLELDAEAGTFRLRHVRGRWAARTLRRRLRAAGLRRG
ncbi:MAG TPA: hypothetical protein VF519_17760 [Mycobacteriales bacterium]